MFNILVYLLSIEKTAKGIHYLCKGENFWADHLLADKIADGLSDFMDEIQEIAFLGKEQDAPQPFSVLASAGAMVPELTEDITEDFKKLDKLLLACIDEIETSSKLEAITVGDGDLLGRICADIQQKHGFIWRRIK